MKTVNYTELRKNLKGYLDGVIDNCEPLIIHRKYERCCCPLRRRKAREDRDDTALFIQ
jgi:hypothetical protein